METYYHYTTTGALHSIVQSRRLRLTHLGYMNDPGELSFGLECVKHALANCDEEKYVVPEQVTAIRCELETWQDRPVTSVDHESKFAMCFSSESDSLSQWRAYGRHPAQPAVSMGFSAESLQNIAGPTLRDVKYVDNVEAGASLVSDWVGLLQPATSPLPGAMGSPFGPSRTFWWERDLAASFLKNSKYSSEQEVRLLAKTVYGNQKNPDRSPEDDYSLSNLVHHRPSNYGLTPYIELTPGEPMLDQVVVGPSPHAALVKNSVRTYLDLAFGRGAVEVRTSECNYRDW